MGATPASLLATVSRPPAWGGPWGLGSLGVQARQVGPWIKTLAGRDAPCELGAMGTKAHGTPLGEIHSREARGE